MTSSLATARILSLTPAQTSGGGPLHDVMQRRRSCREFLRQPLSSTELSQLCWAAQSITSAGGDRTSPSAGGLFPVTMLIMTPEGIFEYLPRKHSLWERQSGDHRQALQSAALDQPFVGRATAIFVLAIDVGLTAAKYSRLAERYCLIEVGHAAQNILLEATSLELGCVPVGLFDDVQVRTVLGLGRNLEPVYLLPVGHPASTPVE